MPYEYTGSRRAVKKPLSRRIKSLFLIQFHFLATVFKGFGATRIAGGIYKWLITLGDDDAMFRLGEMYWWGYKYTRDPVKAIELIEYASIRGNKKARAFKEEMAEDGLWRQGKGRDEFMNLFDDHVIKESNQPKSLPLGMVALYTLLLVGIIYLLR